MTIESTQEKILEAARRVFIIKGMDGARMQEIADEAGINKSLLHYYFRTKQQLFDAIFEESFGKLVPNLMEILQREGAFLDKIEMIVEEYDAMMSKNPFLPQFVIHEINRDPEQLSKFILDRGFNIEKMAMLFTKEVGDGNIMPFSIQHFMANLLGMIIIPYAARPLLQRNLFGNDSDRYDQFLKERKTTIAQFIKQALEKR
jgi:TetR/AcrR family transcriptional regulator